MCLCLGENMVPKSSCKSQTFTGSRTGKTENGFIVAPPPSPLSASSTARIFPAGCTPVGLTIGGQTAHGTSWPHAATAPTASYIAARCGRRQYSITQSAHVVKKIIRFREFIPKNARVCVQKYFLSECINIEIIIVIIYLFFFAKQNIFRPTITNSFILCVINN